MGNHNFHDLFTKFLPYVARSRATRDLANKEIMVTHRKLPFLRDMFVRGQKFLNLNQTPRNYATDHIPVNTAAEYLG